MKFVPKLYLYIIFTIYSYSLGAIPIISVPDSSKVVKLGEVTVTATRTDRILGSEPMPVTFISKREISSLGSLRLNDILAQQTGLNIVYKAYGTGLEVQGFDPAYTLILIDGEPVLGRNNGVLDITRFALGNVKRIEIVKGPSSCLYGSDALAGVVNIITENPEKTTANFSGRYETNQTNDLAGNISVKGKNTAFSLFLDRYSTNGYDLSADTVYGKTIEPYFNYTLCPRFSWQLNPKLQLKVSGRYFYQFQQNDSRVNDEAGNNFLIEGNSKENDFSFNPVLKYTPNKKLTNTLRLYVSGFDAYTNLHQVENGEPYDHTFFNQRFQRPELQSDIHFNRQYVLTLGAGLINESVEATRYDDKKEMHTYYAFTQLDAQPLEKLNVVSGIRYDNNNTYGAHLSPKLSARYDINGHWALMASAGTGFKSPDFEKLYLNFNNSVVGYTVYGTEEVGYYVGKLSESGQISMMLADVSKFGKLKPESSMAFNLGARYIKSVDRFTASINLFRNNVHDLIESTVVAIRKDGGTIFSYENLNRIFTQGAELNAVYRPLNCLAISGGYQYLEAKDAEVVDKINKGEVFRRNPQSQKTERVKMSDYGGLFNRSKNSWNLKISYDNFKSGTSLSARLIYKGRYGFADNNGNGILDESSEYAKGYALVNLSASQKLNKHITIQVGCNDLTNFTDAQHAAGIAGRLFYASLFYSLF